MQYQYHGVICQPSREECHTLKLWYLGLFTLHLDAFLCCIALQSYLDQNFVPLSPLGLHLEAILLHLCPKYCY